jgi:hypothetical protein
MQFSRAQFAHSGEPEFGGKQGSMQNAVEQAAIEP